MEAARSVSGGLLVLALLASGCFGDAVQLEHPSGEYLQYWDSFPALLHWPGLDLEIRVRALPDLHLRPLAEEALLEEVERATGKAVSIQHIPLEGEPDTERRWSMDQLYALADKWHQQPPTQGNIALEVALLDGCVWIEREDRCAAGVAVDNVAFAFDSSVIVARGYDQVVGWGPIPHRDLPEYSQVQRYLTIHEVGHVLGLVQLPIPMQTPRLKTDDPCACHSDQPTSVMYGRVRQLDQESIHLDRLSRGDIHTIRNYRFDNEDMEDFLAFRALGQEALADGFWDPAQRENLRR